MITEDEAFFRAKRSRAGNTIYEPFGAARFGCATAYGSRHYPQHQLGHAPSTRAARAHQGSAAPRRAASTTHFPPCKVAHSCRRHAQAHYLDMSSKPTQDDAFNALFGGVAKNFEAHGNPAGATFVRYGITQNHYRAMSEVMDNPKLRGLMGDMADQLEADGCTEEAALLRDPLSPEEAREMNTAFSKLNEVFDSKKALAKKASGKTEVANSMLCDLYERVKSWEGPGAGMAALIARSKFGATHIDMTDKLFGEMRRLINLDEKAVEEELRKLGVTLDLVARFASMELPLGKVFSMRPQGASKKHLPLFFVHT